MGNGVSSLIFSARSGDKAVNGDIGRTVTCAAQGANAVESFAKTGVVGAKAAGSAVEKLDTLAKTDSIWGKGAQGLKWAQSHVNPLIGVCAATKIVVADDKEKAICTELPGFLTMLAAEGQFKKLQNTKPAVNLLQSIERVGGKKGKFLAALAEGVSFATVSIGSYIGAGKLGEYALEGERVLKAKKLEAMA